MVLVILDGFGLRGKDTLTNKAASLTLVLEGVVLISVLVVSIMGTQLPKSAILFSRLAPGDLLIVALWLVGLWLVNKALYWSLRSQPWRRCWRVSCSRRAATSLPEVVTGLASVKLGDYDLAFSDIFGGNTFLPVLFLLATVLSGQSVLPQAKNTDIYLASLGGLLTAVYLCGLLFRPKKQFLNLGIDSIVVLVLYIVGIGGLFLIAQK